MYINDLGIGRVNSGNSVSGVNAVSGINSTGSVNRIASVNNRNNLARLANTTKGKTVEDYATVMKNAVENQRTVTNPTFATAGDIIIQEAFKKMETDPEWEESVMGKVKEYYAGDYDAGSAQRSYQNLLGTNSLQTYLIQSLIGGQGTLGLGLTGYSPYGLSSQAASAYGNVMNSAISNSLFGSWQL
ncbi:MAG: hypothetical protein K2L82_11960 [Lachnospiraceae bacterium]|nr:hypothetical protein [Lachnospiraceae bacterium]